MLMVVILKETLKKNNLIVRLTTLCSSGFPHNVKALHFVLHLLPVEMITGVIYCYFPTGLQQ